MKTHDAIKSTLATSSTVLSKYISDLSDDDLLLRPGPGCNHLAWQLGHLIASESGLLNSIQPGAGPDLPEGFAAKHSKENTASDNPADFCTRDEYLALADQMHAATLKLLATHSEDDLDRPGPERFAKMFPTVGSIFLLIATHPMMHAGQFVPVRRALGKPVVI